jgi:hypothetical protein
MLLQENGRYQITPEYSEAVPVNESQYQWSRKSTRRVDRLLLQRDSTSDARGRLRPRARAAQLRVASRPRLLWALLHSPHTTTNSVQHISHSYLE